MNRDDRPPPGKGKVRDRSYPGRHGPLHSDFCNRISTRRLIDKNSGRHNIFLCSVDVPLVAHRIVAVRYCLSRDQWDWLRWLSSLEERVGHVRGEKLNRPMFVISANSRQVRHSAPRVGILILPTDKNAPYRRLSTQFRHSDVGAESSLAYTHLIVSRCSQGLLEPFRCAGCGILALDPLGWNGPRQPLCGGCADPTGGPA
jgi:hypothetical protein